MRRNSSKSSSAIRFFDFSGGLNTSSPVTSLAQNEAIDLQNINLLPTGGFEKRRGNVAFNSSAMDSGASVHGTGYYRQADGDDWLMAITGSKIYKSEFDGTMDDITGASVISSGDNNIWTHTTMNDISIWVGGNKTSDVPIKWTGSGNSAALGGSPPVGEFGISANNRFFIGSTIADPSRIYWSVLGNPEDWSGTGSGSQDFQRNDGDTLVGAAVSGIDHMLLFKQNTIGDLAIRNAPFPLFPLFRNVGAISKRGIVSVDGVTYFITPQPRMKATDGSQIFDFPDIINDLWDSLNTERLKYIHGVYYKRLRQIWWFVSTTSASTHDLCIIWDLDRKAWLIHRTGYKMNSTVIARERTAYSGAYDGKLYQMDVASTYTDASESSGAISSYWRTGWMDFQNMIQQKGVLYVDLNFSTQSSGTFEFSHGFDFSQDRKIQTINMQAPGGLYGSAIYGIDVYGGVADDSKLLFLKGRGKFIQFLVRNKNSGQALSFNGFEIPIKALEPFATR